MKNSPQSDWQLPRSRMPTTTSLVAFEAAARTGSFVNAANELCLSASAISKEIKSLEERVGIPLFERAGRGIVLTSAGRTYADRVKLILDKLLQPTSDLGHATARGRIIRLRVLATLGTKWLIPMIADFLTEHPNLNVHFVAQNTTKVSFERQLVDAEITNVMPKDDDIISVRIADQKYTLIASPDAFSHVRSIEQMLKTTLLIHEKQFNSWMNWLSEAHNLDASETKFMTFETHQMLIEAAICGLGIAVVPEIIVRRELQSGMLVELFRPEIQDGDGIYFVYCRSRSSHKNIISFRDWLIKKA